VARVFLPKTTTAAARCTVYVHSLPTNPGSMTGAELEIAEHADSLLPQKPTFAAA